MRTPRQVRRLILECTCTDITADRWNRLMCKATKADVRQVEKLIRLHYSDDKWFVGPKNPYRHKCFKTAKHLIYSHSSIDYFFRYEV